MDKVPTVGRSSPGVGDHVEENLSDALAEVKKPAAGSFRSPEGDRCLACTAMEDDARSALGRGERGRRWSPLSARPAARTAA